jgi:hypothetical protein
LDNSGRIFEVAFLLMKMKTKLSENKKQLKLTIMKTKIGILVLALCTTFFNVQAQRRVVTTARATGYDISDNLDLDAVASIFGDSENLEDFERKLNDPDNRISNLDLNEDGYIDYLRVVENTSDRNSLVVIQAVLDKDVYQDVATIEVERVQNGNPRIQIVGDAYIYGPNYIIEPEFYRTPLIFSFFWSPRYSVWNSPYYWNYYPRWYRYYRPYSPFRYQRRLYVHINNRNIYHRASDRNIHFSGDNYNHIRRNDFATRYPDRAFTNRHRDVSNRNELIERRSNHSEIYDRDNNVQRSNNKVRTENQNSGYQRNERRQPANEGRRPVYNEKSGQTQPKEYNRDSNRNRQEYNNRRTAPRQESVSAPQQSTPRTESTKSRPVEKSVSTPERSRSNREVRQSQPNTSKSEPSKKEEKKETRERRRNE